MKRENKNKVLFMVVLLIAVVGLTVAFAAMSRKLTINGTASMDTAKWDIVFVNIYEEHGISNYNTEGTAQVIKKPKISEDEVRLEDFEVTLSKPGDSVSFIFDVYNKGDIDAKLSKVLVNNISYFDDDLDEEAAKKFIKNLFVKADWDGDGVTTDEEKLMTWEKGIQFDFSFGGYSTGKLLKSLETSSCTLEIWFDSRATELPKGEVKLNIDLELLFEQA